MTRDTIKTRLESDPFYPFTVRLADGRKCLIPAKDFAHVSPGGRTLSVYTEDGEGMRRIDIALIIEIEEPREAEQWGGKTQTGGEMKPEDLVRLVEHDQGSIAKTEAD